MKVIFQSVGLFLGLLPWNLQGLNFTIQDLGTLTTHESTASGINNDNVIVGSTKNLKEISYFMWDEDKGVTPLPFTCTYQMPFINIHREIAGISWYQTNYWFTNNIRSKHLCIINREGADQDIGAPTQWKIQELERWQSDHWDDKELKILAFNDQKQILMTNSHDLNEATQFVVWQDGVFKEIDPSILSIAYTMNNEGLILGRRWVKTETGNLPMLILYDLNRGVATEIMRDINLAMQNLNDRGQVITIQILKEGKTVKGLLWDPQEGLTELEDFAPVTFNNHNQMIGLQISEMNNDKFVWLFWNNGEKINLNEKTGVGSTKSLWNQISSIEKMNDRGYAIGQGDFDGKKHAFILIPSDLD